MNCPKCSAPMLPNAKFCGACGFQTSSQSQIPPPPQQQYQPQQNQPQTNYGYGQQSAGNEAFHFDSDGRGQGSTHGNQTQGAFALAVLICSRNGDFRRSRPRWFRCGKRDLHSEMKGEFRSIKRAVGGDRRLFDLYGKRSAGEVTLETGAPPATSRVREEKSEFLVQSSSYLAAIRVAD